MSTAGNRRKPEQDARGRFVPGNCGGGRKPMGWMPPRGGIAMCQGGRASDHMKEEASVDQAIIIGIDLAKQSFR